MEKYRRNIGQAYEQTRTNGKDIEGNCMRTIYNRMNIDLSLLIHMGKWVDTEYIPGTNPRIGVGEMEEIIGNNILIGTGDTDISLIQTQTPRRSEFVW